MRNQSNFNFSQNELIIQTDVSLQQFNLKTSIVEKQNNWFEYIHQGLIIIKQNEVIFANDFALDIFQTFHQNDLLQKLSEIKVNQTDKAFKQFLNNIQNKSNSSMCNQNDDSIYQSSYQHSSNQFTLNLDYILQLVQSTKYSSLINLIEFKSNLFKSSDYLIQIHQKIKGDQQHIALLFLQMKERDNIINRQFTYKITQKLFKSFEHEFGTTLNCILLLAQSSLLDKQIQNNHIIKYFNPIYNCSVIMKSLVDDMRDYSKILGKQFNIDLNTFSISSLIDEVINLFQRQIDAKKIQIIININDQLTDLNNDRNRLKQILINLFSNALKFTQSGAIQFRASNVIFNNLQYVYFAIKDTGCGMAESEQVALDNFLRAKINGKSISKNSSGFGLGLYISNIISKQLSKLKSEDGGGINFTSELNQGSEFNFLIWNICNEDKIFQNSNLDNENMIIVDRNIILDRRVSKFIAKKEIAQNFLSMKSNVIQTTSSIHQIKNKRFDRKSSPVILYNRVTIPSFNKLNIDLTESIQIDLNKARTNQQNEQFFDDINEEFVDYDEKHNFTYHLSTPSIFIKPLEKIKKFKNNHCKNQKVLIVDDELFNILGLELLLLQFGINSDYALNGFQCIEMIKTRLIQHPLICNCSNPTYSVIFMDINMPQMDGIQTTQSIFQYIKINNLKPPIITACTAYSDLKTKRICYETGMKYFLNKPIEKGPLKQFIVDLDIIQVEKS